MTANIGWNKFCTRCSVMSGRRTCEGPAMRSISPVRDKSARSSLIPAMISLFFSSRRRHTRYWRDWSSDVCSSDLAITFTNKAAGEMKERVAHLVGPRARAMWVSTFHSMCVRILRAEAAKLGLKSSFTIYDQGDSVRLMTMVARDLDLDAKRYPGRSLAAQVSNLKNELIDDESYVPQTAPEKVLAEVYKLYQQRLRQAHSMDFDDLIMNTVHLLQAFPDVAEHYRRRFRHVLVDEYQDTNHAQYMLVRELVGDGTGPVPMAELCVVGDADQSIYAFRGATIRNIDEFERDYPQATTILLEQNYRSTQRILKAANQVIAKNTGRRPKNLWTEIGRASCRERV